MEAVDQVQLRLVEATRPDPGGDMSNSSIYNYDKQELK